ncbi:hypothetical protein [Nocardioides sp. URHA0020]|uniref:hypothetical protein n=1 Tax=Nocardioides sp. URHA0020 TaxID=1380392 RepID=UPI0004910E96|nr:hypothetical protein [Nocardioides sp. URHA0020]
MSSTRRSPRTVAVLLALSLTGSALTACGGDRAPAAAPASPAPADVAVAVDEALAARSDAVNAADVDAFTRTLGGGRRFREQQQTWYANLTQLPLARFRYRFDPASLVRDGHGYWATVEEVMQLDGYDAAPVATRDRFRFVPTGESGRMRLASVTDRRWEAKHRVQQQPWDLGPIEVRAGAGVLGIFDPDSADAAGSLLTSVEAGISDVSAWVPYDWTRTVVVYALSDRTFLDGLEDVPGDDPGDLDAVSFPAGDGTRFVLNPRVIDDPGPARDRLVRHELTHVAVGSHDDQAPVWLSEGLAEWVSVRPLAPEDRRLPGAALRAAEAGAGDLPDDASFNDDDSQAHYGLAWWAVEYVADSYGDDAPWLLLDALAEPGVDPGDVLRDQFATSTKDLAQQADRMILATYAAGSGDDGGLVSTPGSEESVGS